MVLANLPVSVSAKGDNCHVYLIEIKAYRKALARYDKTGDKKALESALINFPAFETIMGEEELTTRHFRIPQTNRVITASVFYTDESITPTTDKDNVLNDNSILLGVVVTRKNETSAINLHSDNAVAEMSYDENVSVVRVKKYLTIKKKMYLIGLECVCRSKNSPKN